MNENFCYGKNVSSGNNDVNLSNTADSGKVAAVFKRMNSSSSEFQTKARRLTKGKTKEPNASSSEISALQNPSGDETGKYPSEHVADIWPSKSDQAEKYHSKTQTEQVAPEALDEECFQGYETYCGSEDFGEIAKTEVEICRSGFQSEEYHLEPDNKECLSDLTQPKIHRSGGAIEEYPSDRPSEQHVCCSLTEDNFLDTLTEKGFPSRTTEELHQDSPAEKGFPSSTTQELHQDSPVEKCFPSPTTEELHQDSPAEKHSPGAPTEDCVLDYCIEVHLSNVAIEDLPTSSTKLLLKTPTKELSNVTTKMSCRDNPRAERVSALSATERTSGSTEEDYISCTSSEEHFSRSSNANYASSNTDYFSHYSDDYYSYTSSEEHFFSCPPSEEHISHFLNSVATHKKCLLHTSEKESFSDSRNEDLHPEELISHNSEEQSHSEIHVRNCTSQVQIKGVPKTEVFNFKDEMLETDTDACETETEISELPPNRGQIGIPNASTCASEIQMQERADIRSEIREVQTLKPSPVQNLESAKLFGNQCEEDFLDAPREALNFESDPEEMQTEKNFCPRKARDPDYVFGSETTSACSTVTYTSFTDLEDECEDEHDLVVDWLSNKQFVECKGIVLPAKDQQYISRVSSTNHATLNTPSSANVSSTHTKTINPSYEISLDRDTFSHEIILEEISKAHDTSAKGSDKVSKAQHSATGESEILAYSAGDKICELTPFVYVLNNDQINFRCSRCFQCIFISSRTSSCSVCSFGIYCDTYCQDKHREIHETECPYICRALSYVDPNTRLLAHAFWRLKETSTCRVGYTFGDKTYYYEDLPWRPDLMETNETIPGPNRLLFKQYEAFRSYVFDISITYMEFCYLYGKVVRNTAYIRDKHSTRIGIGMYFGLASVQLSCYPNSNISFIGVRAQIIACCAIDVADRHEITIRYSFKLAPRAERQAAVQPITGQLCNCNLCQNYEFEEAITELKNGGSSSAMSSIMDLAVNTLKELEQNAVLCEEELFRTVLDVSEEIDNIAGTYNYVRGKILEYAAAYCLKLERNEDAITHFERLLPVYQYFYGPYNVRIVDALHELALSYHKIGLPEKAREKGAECVKVAHCTFGVEHPRFKSLRCDFRMMDKV